MTIELLRATRKNVLKLCQGLTTEQLNHIPEGFNNNLIWNAGHVIATMELLLYGLSGNRTPSGKEFIDSYRKGTRPEARIGSEEITLIMNRLLTSVDSLEKDLPALKNGEYKTYQTSYGVTLTSLEDSLEFNNMHEAMHVGSIIALKKFV